MHVGLVIPAFNVAAWLGDAIRSVLNQAFQDWSLVVVDDGSTDATADVVASFPDPRIHLIRQANAGVSAARNRGLAHLNAEAILFLDADDWLAPDALAILSDTLKNARCAVAAVSGYARTNADGSFRCYNPPPSGLLLRSLLVRNLFANGGHLLIRRQAIDACGGFNTALSYGEDWEYWTRLALLGEFVSVKSREPLLFVRQRAGSAYMTMAFDWGRFLASMDAVFGNEGIAARIGQARLTRLRSRTEAENAWVVGRELVRHLRPSEGRTWLIRSLRSAPSFKRLCLLGLSWLGLGPFRPYRIQGSTEADQRLISGFTIQG
ncbi:glycosyltransferase family 2 protein [Rhodopila sp.]|uniref:glycosyltransferase family 2 protein n=1 Tax=Rhodopila sp. TaxID=2480087 RepID=UPI003D1231DD